MELVVTGANATITVRRGCLHVKTDDIEHRLERVPRMYDRMVIDAHGGLITVEAMGWMADYELAWTVLYRDRGIVASSVDGEGDPLVWRRQVTAQPAPIMRLLLGAKLAGQADVAELLRDTDTAKTIHGYAERLTVRDDPYGIMGYEGKAAHTYWGAWRTVEVPFLADHLVMVPPRWIRWQGRSSLAMETSNRRASDPINALLNYAYRVGETLCVHACYATGLSPVLSTAHSRTYNRRRDGERVRQSMALDLLEAIRPQCDRVVLGMLDYGQGISPYLRWHDFLELNTGVVRLETEALKVKIIKEVGNLQGEVMEWARMIVKTLKDQ